jgi:hypothetical protein
MPGTFDGLNLTSARGDPGACRRQAVRLMAPGRDVTAGGEVVSNQVDAFPRGRTLMME